MVYCALIMIGGRSQRKKLFSGTNMLGVRSQLNRVSSQVAYPPSPICFIKMEQEVLKQFTFFYNASEKAQTSYNQVEYMHLHQVR